LRKHKNSVAPITCFLVFLSKRSGSGGHPGTYWMNRAKGGACLILHSVIQGLGDCRNIAPPAVWATLIKVPEDVPLPVLRDQLNRPSEMAADSRSSGLLSQVRFARV